MKRCTKCGAEHPADTEHFGVDNKRRDGLNIWCKSCTRESTRAFRRRNGGWDRQAYEARRDAAAAARAKWLAIAREAAALAIALLLAAPARAEEPQRCDKREVVVALLAREFDERAVAGGVTEGGDIIVEIFASPRGTWTAVATTPDGRSCIGEVGRLWRAVAPPTAGKAV